MTARPFPEILESAVADHSNVVALTRDLVRIPSRGGIDAGEPVLKHIADWLGERRLDWHELTDTSGAIVALSCEIPGTNPGPRYVLDACLDTAPFGDESTWTFPPVSGEIDNGWMHGRGCADSKVGAAIFAHIGARLAAEADRLHGSVVLLFDVDEHTGTFGGARAFFEDPDTGHVDGVMIGYPGSDHVVTGGRGILRAQVDVHGIAGHSGGRTPTPSAIAKAAMLVQELHSAKLPSLVGTEFPLPARLTVTAITGGAGYSTVPDLCSFNVDVRLTPAFDNLKAANLLRSCASAVDRDWAETPPTTVEFTTGWPPFALPEHSTLRTALLDATHAAGFNPAAKIAGPSNIGNYLAGLGIEATAGFGVGYAGLHATDERIRLDDIPLVEAAYHQALVTLLQPS